MDTTRDRSGDAEPPRIAVTALKPSGARHGKMPLAYVRAVQKAGGGPVVISALEHAADEEPPDSVEVHTELDPDDPATLDEAAGLVLSGGGDIDSTLYGEEPHPRAHNVNRVRDRFELTVLGEALSRDMPVLAICRGMQLLNVCLGGTLEQHLADEPGRLEHDRDHPRGEPAHNLRIAQDNELSTVFEGTRAAVNSRHHQGLDVVAEPLKEVGWAEDGVLEAVVSTRHSWVVAVQWHPETMAPLDAAQLRLFERFVEAAGTYARNRFRITSAAAARHP